jgi:hypothetical protein
MRRHCAFVLVSSLWVLPLALGGDGAAAVAHFTRPSSEAETQSVLEATYVCGMSEEASDASMFPEPWSMGKVPPRASIT